MISLADLQQLSVAKINISSSTTRILKKNISMTKSMPFWLKRSRHILCCVAYGAHKFNRTKIFTSAFKFRANGPASFLLGVTRLMFTSPHLSSSRSVAHKVALLFLHLSLSLARALASSQDFQPAIVLSFSTVRRQLVLGRPTFLLPIGVQVSAVAQWCSLGILRTCPKNLHLLLFTSILILVHPVLSLSSSIDTM